MVVFIDLDSEDDDPFGHHSSYHLHGIVQARRLSQVADTSNLEGVGADVHELKDQISSGRLFASALACYPVSMSIASQLDLIDLYSLSATCREIHNGLSQFSHQLRTRSLRCVNDVPARTSEEEADAIIFQESMHDSTETSIPNVDAPAFPIPDDAGTHHFHVGSNSVLGLRGKVSTCARDMVAPCRKCGIVVCRNCALKPPNDRFLPNRFRRLCRTCLEAPLIDHLHALKDDGELYELPASSSSSTCSARSLSSTSSRGDSEPELDGERERPFTAPTFLRDPCACVTRGVFLCQPCGQSLVPADTTYKRVWTWRSRYSTHIGGGLGTGLGLGNQGQKCGRGEFCLERGAAGVCWVEIECSEARAQNQGRDQGANISRSATPVGSGGEHDGEGGILNRPGYLSQELEGIGGVLKKKVKKRVKVGATVYEFDDERESGRYLVREASGKSRSWCGWCSRVCPGAKDRAEVERLLDWAA